MRDGEPIARLLSPEWSLLLGYGVLYLPCTAMAATPVLSIVFTNFRVSSSCVCMLVYVGWNALYVCMCVYVL